MADALDLLIARGPAPQDFSALGDLPKAYWEGLTQKHTQAQRDAFQGGLPKDAAGNLDTTKILETLLQTGGTPAVGTALPILQQQMNIRASAEENKAFFPRSAASPEGGAQPAAPLVSPSTSRNISTPQSQSPTGYGGGDSGQGTVASIVGGKLQPDHPQAGVIIGNIAKAIGADPNAQLNPEQLDRATRLVGAYTARSSAPGGATPVPQGPPAQAAPAAPQSQPPTFAQRFGNPAAPVSPNAAPQADPTLGGVVPPAFKGDYQRAMDYFSKIASDRAARGDKEGAKVAQDRADIIGKAIGQLREGGIKERQGVLEPVIKQVVERIGTSQVKADALADGILVSHDLMAQLDAKAGIFTGQWANQKLSLAKIGKAVGLDLAPDQITNTEAFSALVGKKVAQTVKSFGSGTSITNQDREYAAKMEAGDIKLDETSMRRILTITDKINRAAIEKHNKGADDLVRSRPELQHLAPTLKVDMPAGYVPPKKTAPTAPAPTTGGFQEGQTATNPQTKKTIIFRNGAWADML